MAKFIDLHTHSNYSDGVYPPADIVAMAAQKGLLAIALADHDTISGIDEAQVAGLKYGVEIVPAIEFSTCYKDFRDVHLLGYFIDHKDPELERNLGKFRERRDNRARAIVEDGPPGLIVCDHRLFGPVRLYWFLLAILLGYSPGPGLRCCISARIFWRRREQSGVDRISFSLEIISGGEIGFKR